MSGFSSTHFDQNERKIVQKVSKNGVYIPYHNLIYIEDIMQP